jgi:hypothetical protein
MVPAASKMSAAFHFSFSLYIDNIVVVGIITYGVNYFEIAE